MTSPNTPRYVAEKRRVRNGLTHDGSLAIDYQLPFLSNLGDGIPNHDCLAVTPWEVSSRNRLTIIKLIESPPSFNPRSLNHLLLADVKVIDMSFLTSTARASPGSMTCD